MNELENQIETLESDIAEKKKQLSELRRQRPEKSIEDYLFNDPKGNEVKLSELFDGHEELIVVQNMGKACSYCTMWADGFNGIFEYIQRKAGFVLASPDAPDVQQNIRSERDWQFPMISTDGTNFKRETGYEDEKGGQHPGVSVFRKKRDGSISYTNQTSFGPGDDFCPVWHFYDMLSSEK